MKIGLETLAKTVLIALGSAAAASATDAAIHKKQFGQGITTSVFSNERLNDTMKILESLEESSLLIKGVSKTIKIEIK